MQLIRSAAAMQSQAKRWKRQRLPVGFVPTMGCLHTGHLSLVRRARRLVGRSGKVLVSIYVNPTQFGPKEDLSSYPRQLQRDMRLCRQAGVDLVFAPPDAQMYPADSNSKFSTWVTEDDLSCGMEGASRPTHFRGVTTIVAKLFNLIQPDLAVFGAKDYQQAAVVKRMVRDLHFPVRIVVAPTVREADGLALSSRNKYLRNSERDQALVLWRSIQNVQAAIRRSRIPVSAANLKTQVMRMVQEEPDARLDYVAFFDPETLAPVQKVSPGAHMALAVFIGKTRLIDNARL